MTEDNYMHCHTTVFILKPKDIIVFPPKKTEFYVFKMTRKREKAK